MVSNATVKYWLDWFKFLAEDRLSGPQCDEAGRVLSLAEQHAALARQRDDLLAALEELATAVKYAHLDSNRYTPGCAVCDALARSDQVVAATGQGEGGA